MSTVPARRLTPQEYLAMERNSQERRQFLDGETFLMSGASRKHNLVTGDLFAAIHSQLKGRPCEAYSADMRVKVQSTGLYTYPDIVVTCDKPRFEDAHVDTLLNPQAIIEVLSPSTEAWDRGGKFRHYRSLPSLREYVLVSQDQMSVERFVLNDAGEWSLSELQKPEDVLVLPSIGCSVSLADIYARIEFDPPAPTESEPRVV